MNRTKKNIK